VNAKYFKKIQLFVVFIDYKAQDPVDLININEQN